MNKSHPSSSQPENSPYDVVVVTAPKTIVKLKNVYEPPKHYNFLQRIKWYLWDSL